MGGLRPLSKTSENWTRPDELREAVRGQMELAKSNMKQAYDRHRHDKLHCTVREIVVMKRAPVYTGESTKLQERYRGPLVVTEVLPGDVYRVAQLKGEGKSRFATTAHISQLKSWRMEDEDEEETEPVPADGELELIVEDHQPSSERRPERERRVPVRLQDYEL